MRKFIWLLAAVPACAHALTYSTSFEDTNVFGDDWNSGVATAYLTNGWSSPNTSPNNGASGFTNNFNNGKFKSGTQSAQAEQVASGTSSSSAARAWSPGSPKKGYVAAHVRLDSGNATTAGRGFGLEVNGWRVFLYNNAGTFQLWRSNAKSFTTGAVSATALSQDTWYHIGIGLDMTSTVANAGKFRVYLNGAEVLSENFTAGAFDSLGIDAKMISRAQTGSSKGRAHFDNFYMTDTTAVPEPATMLALGLGAVAAIRRRKA